MAVSKASENTLFSKKASKSKTKEKKNICAIV